MILKLLLLISENVVAFSSLSEDPFDTQRNKLVIRSLNFIKVNIYVLIVLIFLDLFLDLFINSLLKNMLSLIFLNLLKLLSLVCLRLFIMHFLILSFV